MISSALVIALDNSSILSSGSLFTALPKISSPAYFMSSIFVAKSVTSSRNTLAVRRSIEASISSTERTVSPIVLENCTSISLVASSIISSISALSLAAKNLFMK